MLTYYRLIDKGLLKRAEGRVRGLANVVKNNKDLNINTALVQELVASQFPQWKNLLVRPVDQSGWDNRSFRLGEEMLVRLPSAECYVSQVDKEQKWLPKLSPFLPLQIPSPLGFGKPDRGYPWKWSIYRWIDGKPATLFENVNNKEDFALTLGEFLVALQKVDSTGGPIAGPQNFFRGGNMGVYDHETRSAIEVLKSRIDVRSAIEVWESALSTTWQKSPVWIHGDIAPGNLLVKKEKLSAVIDFGQLGIGDPACDLAIAWTFMQGKSQHIFKTTLSLDDDTWARGRGWALWKALISVVGLKGINSERAVQHFQTIEAVIVDHKSNKKGAYYIGRGKPPL